MADDVRNGEALSGIRAIIKRASVFLVDEDAGVHRGSGTLIRISEDRCAVLTAAHVFEGRAGREPVSVGYVDCRRVLPPVSPVRIAHPEADVALLGLPRATAASLLAYAIDPALIPDDGGPRGESDPVFLSGFPEALLLRQFAAPTPGAGKRVAIEAGFTNVCYETTGDDLQAEGPRVRFGWSDTQRHGSEVIERLPQPLGMSGGGLWRYDNAPIVPRPAIWSAALMLRLVGVQSAWNESKEIVLIEPVSRWGTWFHQEALPAITEAWEQVDEANRRRLDAREG